MQKKNIYAEGYAQYHYEEKDAEAHLPLYWLCYLWQPDLILTLVVWAQVLNLGSPLSEITLLC